MIHLYTQSCVQTLIFAQKAEMKRHGGALKHHGDTSSRLYNKTYYYTGLSLYTPLTITYIIYIINGHVSWLQIRLFSYRSDVNNFIINTVSLITQSISMDPKDSVIMR